LNSNKYISTPDLVKRYSILIDIEGNGYSGRLKHLLWSHRPVILVDRPHKEYFFRHLREWKHYIPVKRDLSDLKDNITWCLEHPDKAKEIAEQAYKFSKEYLTRDACYKEWDKIINKHIKNNLNP
jgi:glycosyltransferase involved in cell wall biosynthesis